MKYLIAYDIKDNLRRKKLFKLLKGFGFNIQKSIFEVPINDKKLIQELRTKIESIIDKNEDVVYIFPFYEKPIANEEFKDFLIGGLHFEAELFYLYAGSNS